MIVDLFGVDNWVDSELIGIEIGISEFEGRDLVIIVGCVVEDAVFEVVTGRVNGVFVFIVAEVTTAILLVDGMEDVEELADTS